MAFHVSYTNTVLSLYKYRKEFEKIVNRLKKETSFPYLRVGYDGSVGGADVDQLLSFPVLPRDQDRSRAADA